MFQLKKLLLVWLNFTLRWLSRFPRVHFSTLNLKLKQPFLLNSIIKKLISIYSETLLVILVQKSAIFAVFSFSIVIVSKVLVCVFIYIEITLLAVGKNQF